MLYNSHPGLRVIPGLHANLYFPFALALNLSSPPPFFSLSFPLPSLISLIQVRQEFQSHHLDGNAEYERHASSVDISLFMIG